MDQSPQMSDVLRRLTAGEQAAEHLRQRIESGNMDGPLPGVLRLSRMLGVSPATVRAALGQLEEEGWVLPAAAGRPRVIAGAGEVPAARRPRALRLMILPGERLEDEDAPCRQMLFDLKAALESEGHSCHFAAKSQSQVGYATERIQRLVAGCEADAWLVLGGKREVLEWFAARSVPTMALGGVTAGLRIAATGMETVAPFRAALRHLMGLGHRRITFLSPAFLRDRAGSPYVRAMQEELAAGGLASGDYNVPDFDETPEGVRALLRENFRVTPPTAIIVTYTTWLVTLLAFMARRGLRPGRDVSVLSLGYDLWLPWHYPAVAHFVGDEPRVLRHILQWIRNVARGREDVRQLRFPLRFVDGASVGPVPPGAAGR